MFGYESYVTLNGTVILASSADITSDRTKIESSAIYGGSMNGLSSAPIGSPYYYDWSNNTGSLTAEATPEFLVQLKSMLSNRSDSVDFAIYSRLNGMKRMSRAWWTNITVSASEDGLMTATVNFVSIENDNFETGVFSGYWENETGLNQCGNFPDPLNTGMLNNAPIPFWKTNLTGMTNVKSWTFSASQDVVKFMGCMYNSSNDAKEPYILGVGIMTSDFKCSTYAPEARVTDVLNMYDIYSGNEPSSSRKTIGITADGDEFLSLDVEVNRISDPVSGIGSTDNIDWDFTVFGIS